MVTTDDINIPYRAKNEICDCVEDALTFTSSRNKTELRHLKCYSLQTFYNALAVRFPSRVSQPGVHKLYKKTLGGHLKIVGARPLMRRKFHTAALYY